MTLWRDERHIFNVLLTAQVNISNHDISHGAEEYSFGEVQLGAMLISFLPFLVQQAEFMTCDFLEQSEKSSKYLFGFTVLIVSYFHVTFSRVAQCRRQWRTFSWTIFKQEWLQWDSAEPLNHQQCGSVLNPPTPCTLSQHLGLPGWNEQQQPLLLGVSSLLLRSFFFFFFYRELLYGSVSSPPRPARTSVTATKCQVLQCPFTAELLLQLLPLIATLKEHFTVPIWAFTFSPLQINWNDPYV